MFKCRRCAEQLKTKRPLIQIVLALVVCIPASAQPQELWLEFTPANTAVTFTLGDILHTVHGSFKLKQGQINYDFATTTVRGKLVIDATSGESGNRSRDHKMHREILESAKYPEIVFRPDRVEGAVAPTGTSTVQVHGMFSIHGADHELTMPVRVEIFPDHWIADTHFSIPYVKWGIKNPSTLFLRVSESVEIDIHATGTNPFPGGAR
ncbi:MAG TPA: YceI family protein [Terriglobales bacterium]|nr:YceI family protein [Terriglobales bacterium]